MLTFAHRMQRKSPIAIRSGCMTHHVLRIALPSIVSNITVPLLSLIDTAIVGHMGAASYIGAVALGGMIFSIIYWLFGFLRMGTGGLTAQAYGRGDERELLCILLRTLIVAFATALLLIILYPLIADCTFRFVQTTHDVEELTRRYFSILIWGAPAVLGLYGFTGWFIGKQNAWFPMLVAVVQNAINAAVSLWLVLQCGWKIEGVATGTLVAQYVGLLLFFSFWLKSIRTWRKYFPRLREVFCRAAFARFFAVNRDIFLRTLCLIAVSTYFTAAGSAQGEITLAANALLLQFFYFYSYIMDGFAYAGEALGGRFLGERNRVAFRSLTHNLFLWGVALGCLATLIFSVWGGDILRLLTNEERVWQAGQAYLPYALCIPLVSTAAFILDGLFVGTTSTRYMLWSMLSASVLFFLLVFLLPQKNAVLWVAFLVYLGVRGIMSSAFYPKVIGAFSHKQE